MVKKMSDVGAVAAAIQEFFSWLREFMSGTEIRDLKNACRNARAYIRRTEKIFLRASEDKHLLKYKRNFEKKLI